MKHLFTLLAITAVFFSSCKKDEDNNTGNNNTGGNTLNVEKRNRALFMDFTATWCGPCGQYGGPAFDAAISSANEDTLLTGMKVYSPSSEPGMGHPFYTSMTSAFNVSGIPAFFVNNTSASTSTSNVVSKAVVFQNDTSKIIAGIGVSKTIAGDSMKVSTKTQFFKPQNVGVDYKMAIYIVEDNVIETQLVGSTDNANYVHRNVLRASNGTTYSGVSINSAAAITVDQVFEKTYSIYLNPAWNKANLKAIAVLWKGGASPTIVNSRVAK